MNDAFLMNVFQSSANLSKYVKNIFFWNLFALILINKILQTAFTEFHYNCGGIVLLDQILYLYYIKVIELSKIIDLSKDFFFLGTINVRIKEVVVELFHGIELLIDVALDFDYDSLSTFVVYH